jgi:hypothetical protein
MKYFAVFVISLAIGFVIGILIPAPANTLVPPSATRPEFDRTSIITIAAPAESKESGPLSWSGIFAETTIFDQLYRCPSVCGLPRYRAVGGHGQQGGAV